MASEKIEFKNREGYTLSARLELPSDQHPHNYVLFAHCFTCSKNLNAVKHISRAMTKEGFAVLRFDFTGLGESEGEFSETNFSSNVNDLLDACLHLDSKGISPTILVGHSLGGAAVLAAGPMINSVKAVATIGAPYEPEHVLHQIEGQMDEIMEHGQATVNLGGRPFRIKKQFIEDVEKIRRPDYIRSLHKALLVLHSPQDEIVSIDDAARIYKAATHPRSFVDLDGADHLLTNEKDAHYVGKIIGEWARRYVDLPSKQPLKLNKDVAVHLEDSFTADVRIGKHGFTADEPEEVGGNDFGPTPYDLLVASLGTCTAMTLRMYADHKNWPLKEVEVHLMHQKVHKDDIETELEGDKSGKIDTIEREVVVIGDALSEEQVERLKEIANRCPVHRTLEHCVHVETTISRKVEMRVI